MHPLKPSGLVFLHLTIIMIVITTCCVGLRFVARYKTRTGLFIEDWLIVLALLLYYTFCGVCLRAIINPSSPGSLVVTDYVSAKQFNDLLLIVYIDELLFIWVISTTKFSILCFYRSIFATKSFLRLTKVFLALCGVWLIIMTCILAFQCNPIDDLWHYPTGLEHCMPTGRLLLGSELSNLVLDVGILCLPVYMVRRLRLSFKKKAMVCSLFLLGAFVCITCIVRMHYLFDPKQPQNTRSQPGVFNWSIIELGFAIISACLPLYGPIFSMITVIPNLVKSWHGSHSNSTGNRSTQGYQNTIGDSWDDRGATPKPPLVARNSGSGQVTRYATSGESFGFSYPMEPVASRSPTSSRSPKDVAEIV